jgi:hypothetical protein
MRYYLWIDGKQDGPHELAKIRELLLNGQITQATLARPEVDGGQWSAVSTFPQFLGPANPSEPGAPTVAPKFALPPIQVSGIDSAITSALTIMAVLEFVGTPIVGFAVGSDNMFSGGIVFLAGLISGLTLLGFARVIQNTSETSQRLKRLEILTQREYGDKNLKPLGII